MPTSGDFRIRLTDRDGNLIRNRKGTRDYYNDNNLIEYFLAIDCRERGVKLVSYTMDADGVYAIVDYL